MDMQEYGPPCQFEDEHAKIVWAMSFMKSGQAVHFVDRQMRSYQDVEMLRTELETSKYFQ